MRAGPTVLFARTELRRRGLNLLGLAVLIALAGAFVLTAATGARRVATAWTRFGAETRSPNLVATPPIDQLESVATELRSQRGVEGVSALAWMPIRPRELDNPEEGGFAAMLPDFGTDIYRALVLDGRLADQSRADEFTINPALSRLTGLRVGDHTTLISEVPGVEINATVVGITRGPLDTGANGDGPGVLYTLALAQRFLEPIRTYAGDAFQPALIGRLNASADQASIVARLTEQFPNLSVGVGDVLGGEATTALAVEERADWILAAAAGLAAILGLGQILVRSLRHSRSDVDSLGALGCSTRQRMIMLMAAPMAALTTGIAAAFIAAYAASTLVPTGLASRIDPEPGAWVDIRFAIVVALALAGAMTLTLVVTARRLVARRATTALDGGLSSKLTAASHSASSLLGVRAALGGPDAATRRSARSGIAIIAVAVASVLAVPLWAASLDSLRGTPRAHGWDFDAAIEDSSVAPTQEGAASEALAGKLDAAAITSAIERVDLATVTVTGGKLGFNEVELMIVQPRSGSLHPTLQRGRSPVGPDEIAISTQLLRELHATLGDTIELEGPAGTNEFTIVGEAIFPQLGNAEWGGAGSVTDNAVEALGLEVTASILLIDLAPGRSLADARTIIGPDVLLRTPAPPPVVDNLREAEPILRVLAIFLALLAAATLTHALVTTAQRRRRDHATARAMGLTGRQLTAAFGWQSGTIALVATVVALPLGILIGAVAWRLSTRNLGVLDTFHVPPVTPVFIAVATPTIAVLGAIAVAINARRAPLATSLSTE